MILSPADTSQIHQALENITNEDAIKTTVLESIEIAMRKIKGTNSEIVSALEEMLLNDLLQVAIVIPSEGNGLFHSKFSIYHIDSDSEIGAHLAPGISKYVAVHGSFNESAQDMEKTSKMLRHIVRGTLEFEVAQVFEPRFDELWNDFAEDAISIPINQCTEESI